MSSRWLMVLVLVFFGLACGRYGPPRRSPAPVSTVEESAGIQPAEPKAEREAQPKAAKSSDPS